jgi:hypothetical protein
MKTSALAWPGNQAVIASLSTTTVGVGIITGVIRLGNMGAQTNPDSVNNATSIFKNNMQSKKFTFTALL